MIDQSAYITVVKLLNLTRVINQPINHSITLISSLSCMTKLSSPMEWKPCCCCLDLSIYLSTTAVDSDSDTDDDDEAVAELRGVGSSGKGGLISPTIALRTAPSGSAA